MSEFQLIIGENEAILLDETGTVRGVAERVGDGWRAEIDGRITFCEAPSNNNNRHVRCSTKRLFA